MEQPRESLADVLDRLLPLLEVLFPALQITEERARQIIEAVCMPMVYKQRAWRHPEPELLLMARILDQCWRARKEESVEDPPE